jgi:hypothetical protein
MSTHSQQKMNFKISPLYKRLIAFLVVIGPIYWLVFTEDGQRRTDSVVLYLWGEDEINFNLEALDEHFTENELHQVYPDIAWQCQENKTIFGNRLCTSKIGIYNGIPAHYITVFFHDQRINGVKIAYRRIYHEQVTQQLLLQMGDPAQESGTSSTGSDNETVLRWDTSRGNVILKKVLRDEDDASLFWLPHPSS